MLILKAGPLAAYAYLGEQLFAAEFLIHKNVALAVANSPEYTLMSAVEIFFSVWVAYWILRFFKNLVTRFTNAEERAYGPWFIAMLIFLAFEIGAVRALDGSWFFPFKDGFLFLILNLGPVVSNIHLLGRWRIGIFDGLLGQPDTITNSSLNSTTAAANSSNISSLY